MMTQRGNALFLILIAVALFAALSYAVTQSGRGGGGIDREQQSLDVSQLQAALQGFGQAMDRMRLLNRLSDVQPSFQSARLPAWYNAYFANPNCTNASCELFSAEGGGATYVMPPANIVNRCRDTCPQFGGSHHLWSFSGNVASPGSGTAAGDLLATLRVDQQTCMAVNRAAGIDNPSGAPPQWNSTLVLFADTFAGTYQNNLAPAEVTGKNFGCVNMVHGYYSNNYAWVYFVLLAR